MEIYINFPILSVKYYMNIRFSNKHIGYLKRYYKYLTVLELSNLLGKTKSSIEHKVSRLGLRKQTEDKIYSEFSSKITDPNLSYLLGYFWADAHLRLRKGKRIDTFYFSFTILTKDFKEIRPLLQSTCEYRSSESKKINRQSTTTVRINNQEFCRFLGKLDFVQKSQKQPNKLLETIDSSVLNYWFRGYLDGDGCVSFKEKGYKCVSFSGPFNQNWNFLESLYSKLEINKFTIKNRKRKYGDNSSIDIYNSPDIIKLGEFIYKNIKSDKIGLSRKYNKYQALRDYYLKNLGQPG